MRQDIIGSRRKSNPTKQATPDVALLATLSSLLKSARANALPT